MLALLVLVAWATDRAWLVYPGNIELPLLRPSADRQSLPGVPQGHAHQLHASWHHIWPVHLPLFLHGHLWQHGGQP